MATNNRRILIQQRSDHAPRGLTATEGANVRGSSSGNRQNENHHTTNGMRDYRESGSSTRGPRGRARVFNRSADRHEREEYGRSTHIRHLIAIPLRALTKASEFRRRLPSAHDIKKEVEDPKNLKIMRNDSCDVWEFFTELIDEQRSEFPEVVKVLYQCLAHAIYLELVHGAQEEGYGMKLVEKWFNEISVDTNMNSYIHMSSVVEYLIQIPLVKDNIYLQNKEIKELMINWILEHATNSERVKIAVHVLKIYEENSPLQFSESFEAIMDIFIGVCIDPDASPSVHEHLLDYVVMQKHNWLHAEVTYFEYIGDFTTDIESATLDGLATADEQRRSDHEGQKPDTVKVGRLIRLARELILMKEGSSNDDYWESMTGHTITGMCTIIKNFYYSVPVWERKMSTVTNLQIDALLCLEAMLIQCIIGNPEDFTQFMEQELQCLQYYDDVIQKMLLELIPTMVEKLPLENMTGALQLFTGLHIDKILYKSVFENIVTIYMRILSVKDMSLIQIMYRSIRESILHEMRILEHLSTDTEFQSSTHTELHIRTDECKIRVIVLLATLTNVARDSTNLILMYALDPSLYHFLLRELLLSHKNVITQQGEIGEAILKLLLLHSESNRHFASKSIICGSGNSTLPFINMGGSESADDKMLDFLQLFTDVFHMIYIHPQSLKVLTKFMRSIIETISDTHSSGLTHKSILSVIEILIKIDSQFLLERMLLDIKYILHSILSTTNQLKDELLRSITDFVFYNIGSELPSVQTSYIRLLPLLPLALVTSRDRPGRKERYILQIKQQIKQNKLGVLKKEEFVNIASCLFKLQNADNLDLTLMQDVARSAENSSLPLSLMLHHTGLLEYWTLWQTAEFCVCTALKTPIGSPLNLFTTIDQIVRQIALDCKIEVSPKSGAKMRSASLILRFMENFEKVIYNAFEGCSGFINTPSKRSRAFFRSNRSTCLEALTRMRVYILAISEEFSHTETTMRHCYEVILDCNRKSKEAAEWMRQDRAQKAAALNAEVEKLREMVIPYLVKAFIKLRCPEGVLGISPWYREITNRKLTFIKPAHLIASNKLEKGVVEMQSCISSMINAPPSTEAGGEPTIRIQQRTTHTSPVLMTMVCQQVSHGYIQLQSWDEARDWLKQIQTYKQDGLLSNVEPLSDSDKLMLRENDGLELLSWSEDQQLDNLLTLDPSCWSKTDRVLLDEIATHQVITDSSFTISSNVILLLSSQYNQLTRLTTTQTTGVPVLLQLKDLLKTDSPPEFNLFCCSQARKSENFKLAGSLLTEITRNPKLQSIIQLPDDLESVKLKREAAKLLYMTDDVHSALDIMYNVSLIKSDADPDTGLIHEQQARSTLTIHKWLSSDTKMAAELISPNSTAAFKPWLAEMISKCHAGSSEHVPEHDRMLGGLLELSTEQCPELAKTWLNLANWSYKWAMRRKQESSSADGLSSEEIEQVKSVLPEDIDVNEASQLITLMTQPLGILINDDENADDTPDMTDDRSEIRRQLSDACPSLEDSALDKMVELWKQAAKRMYHLFEQTARSYFTFLQIDATSESDKRNNENVTATLRLLKLVVKHAYELRDVLEAGLSSTPTAPWRSIIPQLFSRLNHPEAYVRQAVADLLARIAMASPHLIVYPAIVGSETNKSTPGVPGDRIVTTSFHDSDDEEVPDISQVELSNAYSQLVSQIAEQHPNMIQQVSLFVREFCRISVTYDELWLGHLNSLHSSVQEKAKELKVEVEKVERNKSLSVEDRQIIISKKRNNIVYPIIHSLERIINLTNKQETKNEQWFHETYKAYIDKGLQKLKHPVKDGDLQSDWLPFKQLHTALNSRSQKRASQMLKMKELSHVLASFSDTQIPLPGQINPNKQPITLKSVCPHVQILTTKTKPKKIAFNGSDGQRYNYLFKGMDDLHLDERIMQMLSIVNDMLRSRTIKTDRQGFQARNYSVTPLGMKSGLIQWVDGCLSLFTLYKRWQIREAQSKSTSANPTVQKPSELFYEALTPLLERLLNDRKISPKDIREIDKVRKEWPRSAQISAVRELIERTPGYLVAKEMWCFSVSTTQWWNITQTFSRSVAVMSAIGYILGLGDRHLENLLLDLQKGELVHIDYNICFDKGKSLRVSEKVPFRLTQNLQEALGPTGVEGIFRSAFESTIKTLRTGKETLLTLLEAFVYDPLVDWTAGNEAGYTGAFYGGNYAMGSAAKNYRERHKVMEQEINRSMFSIRVTEIKSAWLQNQSELLKVFNELKLKVDDITESQTQIQQYEMDSDRCTSALEYIDQIKSDNSTLITDIQKRYSEHTRSEKQQKDVTEQLTRAVSEMTKHRQHHMRAIQILTESKVSTMKTRFDCIPLPGKPASACATSVFKSFGGAQNQAETCTLLEEELKTILDSRRQNLSQCIRSIQQYAALIHEFPKSYPTETVLSDCLTILSKLSTTLNADKCASVREAFESSPRLYPPASRINRCVRNEAALRSAVEADSQKIETLEQQMVTESSYQELLQNSYVEQITSLTNILQDKKRGELCRVTVTNVILQKLTPLSRKYLKLERLALGASKGVASQTCGVGYVDELTGIIEQVLEYIQMLTMETNEEDNLVNTLYTVISDLNDVYTNLQEMLLKFQSDILPAIIRGNTTSNTVILSVQKSLLELGGDDSYLKALTQKLESTLRSVIFGTQDESQEVMENVSEIQQKYSDLITINQSDFALVKGTQSLIDLNELFNNIYKSYESAMEAQASLAVHKPWNKVDIIREAKSMQQTAYNEKTQNIISQLYFMRKLQTIRSIYQISSKYVSAFTDLDSADISDRSYEFLSEPIHGFISLVINKHLLGTVSQCVGYLICNSMIQLGLDVDKEIALKDFGASSKVVIEDLVKKSTSLQINKLSQKENISKLINHIDEICVKRTRFTRLGSSLSQLKVQRSQQQKHLICYQWLHENLLKVGSAGNVNLCQPSRDSILIKLSESLSGLDSNKSVYDSLLKNLEAADTAIRQRLKWAAGSTPQLNTTLDVFERAQAERTAAVKEERSLSSEAVNLGNSILHLEKLRTHETPESLRLIDQSRQLLIRYEEVCSNLVEDHELTEEQLFIMSLLSETDRKKTGKEFFSRSVEQVKAHRNQMNQKIRALNKSVTQTNDRLKIQIDCLQGTTGGVYNSHRQLISEVKPVLVALEKEENQSGVISSCGVSAYTKKYRDYLDKLIKLKTWSLTNENQQLSSLHELISELEVLTDRIFDWLLELAEPVKMSEDDDDSVRARSPVKTESKTRPERILRDPKTGKAIQERNSYAMSVYRRVKMKLEGKELDPTNKLSVSEQVNYVIREAVDIENLAQMYEGWTSWV